MPFAPLFVKKIALEIALDYSTTDREFLRFLVQGIRQARQKLR